MALGYALAADAASSKGVGVVVTVVNADGGVYWRGNPPDWNNPIAKPGYGVYNGDRVELKCWTKGSTVPPYYNNSLWYDAVVVSGQGKGEGYVNDHFLDTGSNVPNQVMSGVPQCGAQSPPPTQAPAPNPSVSLAQGPSAPQGYRYAISLSNFSPNSSVSITCYDSVSPGGFYTFSLTTNGSGNASTASYCYSGDGPDHWVVAGGHESNHTQWGGSGSTSTTPTTPTTTASPPTTPTTTASPSTTPTTTASPPTTPTTASTGGDSGTFTIVNADGGVYWRGNPPDWNNPIANPGHGVYNGDQVRLNCWTSGSTVPPYYNNSLWYDATVVSGQGKGEGFVNDHFIDTGVNVPNQVVAGVPECAIPNGGSTTPKTTSQSSLANAFYDRGAAVKWAKAHAKDPQAYGAMCTWFVSNALWAGGFPKTSTWTNAGRYTSAPGTKTAWWLPSFKTYVQSNFSTTWTNITGDLKTNAVPHAQPGDLILYDWNQGDGISHVAMVVGIASGQYPEVAEWGQYDLNPFDAALNKIKHIKSTYVEREWTWSVVKKEWLQTEHHGMKAYLLHFNGGFD